MADKKPKPTFDMTDFRGLERLLGRAKGAEVCCYDNKIMVARVAVADGGGGGGDGDGQWYALNRSSEDPYYLRNRQQRATWAHAVGASVKDVEAYVRRKRRAGDKESLRQEIENAKYLLRLHGETL